MLADQDEGLPASRKSVAVTAMQKFLFLSGSNLAYLARIFLTMQISRHWRLNAQRYRLEGYRHADGRLSLQVRPAINTRTRHEQTETEETREKLAVPVV